MKKTIFLLLFPLVMLQAKAQKDAPSEKKFQLGVGFGTGLYSNEGTAVSATVELQGEGKLSQRFSLYGGLGYNRLFGDGGSAGFASILAGPRVWFSDKFFAGIGGGLAIFLGGDAAATAFNYNPHIGLNTKKAQFILGYSGIKADGENIGLIQGKVIFKLK